MTVRELRSKFLRFFEAKGHLHFPSASLVPYDVTGRLDESLLFTGAGMVQFKPYFRGIAQPDHKRLMTCQKCVRTGDIDIVGDDTHLTFFEMLGNFSFGDYFKTEAIAYSWEFLTSTEWLGLDPQRLSFTIYEEDDEAFAEWCKWFATVGIDGSTRVFRLDDETNYWPAGAFTKGPPGPCGPNSEMFYWVADSPPPGPKYTRADWIADDAAVNWVEIWNDVFIQYEWQGELKNPSRPAEGFQKTGMPELPFRSIDTGMGLDRTALVLGGYRSVYDTDVFLPIFEAIDALGNPGPETDPEEVARARRVIADHIRTAVFCISDGVLPANNGRGYVLRRLIRRAVLKGVRALQIKEPFFHLVYEGVVASMGDYYTELTERRDVIVETLRNEEALFRRTLENGLRLLNEQLQAAEGAFSGASAFHLYDTFGFPLEVTQEICRESGIEIDVDEYDLALGEAQARSRSGQEREAVYSAVGGVTELAVDGAPDTTDFTGYADTQHAARIVKVRMPEGSTTTYVALDNTPFYAESGGQVGDTGDLCFADASIRVLNTTKNQGTFWHEVASPDGHAADSLLGQVIVAKVDAARRARILRNHTATHLLQAALRRVLGTHVTQAGSHVSPSSLRFDFTHGRSLAREELEAVERMVVDQILANSDVTIYVDIPIAEAKARGAMALFGEKYGNSVRMVEVADFSRELCGGTHVRTTGQIGLFKIVSESSAASGVRRIEAITGEAAYEFVLEQSARISEAAALLKAMPRELVHAVERQTEALRDERKKRERAEAAMAKGSTTANSTTTQVGTNILVTQRFEDLDSKIVSEWVDDLVARDPHAIALAALVVDGKITFTCKVGGAATAHAGNLVREVAKIAGGGGGGRPEFATAGGKDVSKVDEALAAAPSFL